MYDILITILYRFNVRNQIFSDNPFHISKVIHCRFFALSTEVIVPYSIIYFREANTRMY